MAELRKPKRPDLTVTEAIAVGVCPSCKEQPKTGEFSPCCSERCRDSYEVYIESER